MTISIKKDLTNLLKSILADLHINSTYKNGITTITITDIKLAFKLGALIAKSDIGAKNIVIS